MHWLLFSVLSQDCVQIKQGLGRLGGGNGRRQVEYVESIRKKLSTLERKLVKLNIEQKFMQEQKRGKEKSDEGGHH